MNCPYCSFQFKILAAFGDHIPDVAPVCCENCGEISLLVNRKIRRVTTGELEQIKQSAAWPALLAAKAAIASAKRALNARNN